MTEEPLVQVLSNVHAALEDARGAGAVWRLAEPGRQLDANLVRLPAGESVGEHVEPALDVLVSVVAGSGRIAGEPVAPGDLVWLPRGAPRSVHAGRSGLAYVTVHQRPPGLQVQAAASPGSGPPPGPPSA